MNTSTSMAAATVETTNGLINGSSASITSSSSTSSISTSSTSATHSSGRILIFFLWKLIRTVVLDVPMLLMVVIMFSSILLEHLWSGPMMTLIDSYRREGSADDFGYLHELDSDVTYYARQCTQEDVSTTDSNDLIVPDSPETTSETAADIMMTHGAVLIKDILNNQTATQLRAYLEARHHVNDQNQLPYQEKFWAEIGRLALGLGVDDDPIIGQALEQVGNHAILQKTLEGIVGKNPAVVEISTLSAMHGCQEQGIHTDSDFFGSSLLYSRTFLHSYTLFMALQDTTSQMGATTVCPGTHWCANEDLQNVCLDPNYNQNIKNKNSRNGNSNRGPAFEVSSNGLTGKHQGVLHKGSGMMFNQNIWHRGPRNFDRQFPVNRVMFIVTFVSRRELLEQEQEQVHEHEHDHDQQHDQMMSEGGDVRQQGLGTYYYQRWNMWGHTLEDLKHASTQMTQPWAGLRALGLYYYSSASSDSSGSNGNKNKKNKKKSKNSFGILWLEHFARQLANREDFYADYELPEFQRYLKEDATTILPKEILLEKGGAEDLEDWEEYFRTILDNALDIIQDAYQKAMAVYLGIYLLLAILTRLLMVSVRPKKSNENDTTTVHNSNSNSNSKFQFVRRIFWMHLSVGLILYGFWIYVNQYSYLAHRIHARTNWAQPFAPVATLESTDNDNGNGDATSASASTYISNALDDLEDTTVPERMDVLIGSRFDAPFLASFDRVLDYHPGNKRYRQILLQEHELPLPLLMHYLFHDTSSISIGGATHNNKGVPSRMLQQDYRTGYWTVKTDAKDVRAMLHYDLQRLHVPMKKLLGKHLKQLLAKSRFGLQRHTNMAHVWTPKFVQQWEHVLFETTTKMPSMTSPSTTSTTTSPSSSSSPSPSRIRMDKAANASSGNESSWKIKSIIFQKKPLTVSKAVPRSSRLIRNTGAIRVGDRVLANYRGLGQFLEATVSEIHNDGRAVIDYTYLTNPRQPKRATVVLRAVQKYQPIVQGDFVEVNDEQGFFQAIVALAHPLGTYDIEFVNDEEGFDYNVARDSLRLVLEEEEEEEAVSDGSTPSENSNEDGGAYSIGQLVLCNYMGHGEWFPGHIARTHADDETFSVQFDDGDFEDHVAFHNLEAN